MSEQQSRISSLQQQLADSQQAHRADNLRLVDERQQQINRAIVAEARVRELEAVAHSVVFAEVNDERANQDAQWGGPEHDDQHVLRDWLAFIEKQTAEARIAQAPEVRRRLVKIAALAVAGIESIDRGVQ